MGRGRQPAAYYSLLSNDIYSGLSQIHVHCGLLKYIIVLTKFEMALLVIRVADLWNG